MSCKGANKRAVKTPLETYRSVLFEKKTGQVENRGIRNLKGTISTYRQKRNSFHYFYVKRTILEDGISTAPLKATLTPWCHDFIVLDKTDPLALSYIKPFVFEGKSFFCARQVILYKQAQFEENHDTARFVLNCANLKELFQFNNHSCSNDSWLEKSLNICHDIIKEKDNQWAIKERFRDMQQKQIFAAGWDRFWECGMEKRLAEVSNPNEFCGQNNLGKLIQSYISTLFNC